MFADFLSQLTLLALIDGLLIAVVIPVVLMKKRDSTVAVAWCLVVLLMPVVGALLFWVFGFAHVQRRRALRKRQHRSRYRTDYPPSRPEAFRGRSPSETVTVCHPLAQIALQVDGFAVSMGNAVQLYHDTTPAFEAMLSAIEQAQHHVHLQFYIVRDDSTGRRLAEVLLRKARAGVQVRFLYDSLGSFFLSRRLQNELHAGGVRVCSFLPLNPLQSRIQVNLRNHRKIVVVDGRIAFTGGMNIGDEYLGLSKRFGYWRDTFVQIRGPAVAALQRVFSEDWHFAAGELLNAAEFFPEIESAGPYAVQVLESGPDQECNTSREVYFAAILEAKKRLWIASPYFVPDNGILDALRLARLRGVDVRLLCLLRPDHFLSFHASRYYWSDLLHFGGQVYQYARGMMHSKILLVDDNWAMVGTSNLDNRSLRLNFEVNCVFYAEDLVQELATQFERDLSDSIPLDPWTFAQRSLWQRLCENACRLFAPIL